MTNFIHEDFQDSYAGEAPSELEWIESHIEDTGLLDGVPDTVRDYFDTEAYLRDMRLGADVSFVDYDGTTYTFWNR